MKRVTKVDKAAVVCKDGEECQSTRSSLPTPAGNQREDIDKMIDLKLYTSSSPRHQPIHRY